MSFLRARWRHLVLLNYAVDPALLAPLVPRGTVLDLHEGRCWMSVVGFLFLDTRVRGLAIPGHQDFEELNLRFYVRREVADEARGEPVRRGVVFVKELVPRFAIATVARLLYNENYVALPMDHTILRAGEPLPEGAPLQPGDPDYDLLHDDNVVLECYKRCMVLHAHSTCFWLNAPSGGGGNAYWDNGFPVGGELCGCSDTTSNAINSGATAYRAFYW